MIYLLKSGNYLKIGLTSRTAEQRIKDLQTGNPEEITIIDTREGHKDEERLIHTVCKNWHVRNEWFEDCPEVRNIFSSINLERLYKYGDFNRLQEEYNKLLKQYKTISDEIITLKNLSLDTQTKMIDYLGTSNKVATKLEILSEKALKSIVNSFEESLTDMLSEDFSINETAII